MTTTTKKKTGKKPSADKQKHIHKTKKTTPKKNLRIRPELLPETATYGTFADKEYVMIPVEDFGEWFEDITLGSVADDRIVSATEPPISLDKYLTKENGGEGKRKAKK